ncbi:hypothetical protein ENKNEFLB_03901 [Nocardioides aquaticus]|uniref:DUF982 domain-containing protein n=1 Tax=Nocardioides aquaticus TaxID=160826 RepID=A0ABX8EM97_9ACTN|nr:hypothetical protein [Nocardioides aquaticus]QVT81491.1 hypothetical protein ENKNEFLB_03901 [Nocardioides aquaticus]
MTTDMGGFFRLGPAERVRVPADDDEIRTVAQMPPDEMDLAVVNLTRDAVTVEDEALVGAVCRLFGWRRAGGDIQAAVQTSVDRCLRAGTLVRQSSGVLRAA